MISIKDIAWSAGFLEGEGSFGHYGSLSVTAGQVQKEPLVRLQKLFGGSLYHRHTSGFSNRKIWIWSPNAFRAAEIMMTLYVLMSPKRKRQIKNSLKKWRHARRIKPTGGNCCWRGHQLIGENIYLAGVKKYRRCKKCITIGRKNYRAKLRASGHVPG